MTLLFFYLEFKYGNCVRVYHWKKDDFVKANLSSKLKSLVKHSFGYIFKAILTEE